MRVFVLISLAISIGSPLAAAEKKPPERKADGWPDQTRLAVLDLASGKTSVMPSLRGAARPGRSTTADRPQARA